MKFKDYLVFLLDFGLYVLFLWELTTTERMAENLVFQTVASLEELQYFVFGLSLLITIFFCFQIWRFYRNMENVWEYMFWNERIFALLLIIQIFIPNWVGLQIVLLAEIGLASLSIAFNRNKDESIFRFLIRFLIFCGVLITIILVFSWIYEIQEIITLLLDWSMYFAGGYLIFFLLMWAQAAWKKKKKDSQKNGANSVPSKLKSEKK